MNIFLRAKHWQLFLLTFGLPMIFQFIMMGTMFARMGSGVPPDPSMMLNFFNLFPVVMIIYAGTLFGWFWSVAMRLQKKVPANVKMKTKKFKVFFFIPLVYLFLMLFAVIAMLNSSSGEAELGEQPDPGLIVSSVGIIVPLHLFSMFCIFYTLYFVAKTIKTVELQRETTFPDFVGEFFLIWFYPIGIWILQPKINKLWEQDNSGSVGMVIDLIDD